MARKSPSVEDKARDVIAILESLLAPSSMRPTKTVLADLLIRASEPSTIDGYPKGQAAEKTSGGESGDSVLGAVMARSRDICDQCAGSGHFKKQSGQVVHCKFCEGSGRRWADPIAVWVEELVEHLETLWREAKVVDARRVKVVGVHRQALVRKSSLQGECLVCLKPSTGVGSDRLRRGLCNACSLSFSSWSLKNPGQDITKFTMWRRARLAEKAQQEMDAIDRERELRNLPRPRTAVR